MWWWLAAIALVILGVAALVYFAFDALPDDDGLFPFDD
jgi:hypothetical protein